MKKAFSLIELTIVIAITAVLLLVVTNFLISAIRNNNTVTIENDVRSEANSMMDVLAKDIRASRCECLSSALNRLLLYGVTGCDQTSGCPAPGPLTPTPYATYTLSAGSQLLRNSVAISSSRVWVRSCSDCACTSHPFTSGFAITGSLRVYTINLSLTQSIDNPRADFCGKVSLNQVISPRNKN